MAKQQNRTEQNRTIVVKTASNEVHDYLSWAFNYETESVLRNPTFIHSFLLFLHNYTLMYGV